MNAIGAVILLSLTLVSSAAMALETDNYLAWEVDLPDSRDRINTFINERIEVALNEANSSSKDWSCTDITLAVAKKFKVSLFSRQVKAFLTKELGQDYIYPSSSHYLEKSVLANTRFYLKFSGLSPSLQVNGFYFGADKLDHFASTGRRYLLHYLKKKKQGLSDQEATESAIRYGLLNEASVLGWWASGVFSYGDVEANFQGLLFYKKMCLDDLDPYLEKDETGKWHLRVQPDLRQYVNPYWDESYNQSFYTASSWPQVKSVIQDKYCDLRDDPRVVARFKHYDEAHHTSYSLEYIKRLQAEGYKNSPIPSLTQSIPELCKERSESPTFLTQE